jgi:EpsI family protein
VFMVCTALLLAEMAILNRVGRESGSWRQLFGIEFPAPTPQGAVLRQRAAPRSFIAASSVLLAFVIVALALPRAGELIPDRARFSELPLDLPGWDARRSSMEGIYIDTLKLDDYLLADFTNGTDRSINLYMAYYNSQRKGEAVHSPRSCLPGGGWQLRDFDQRTLLDVTVNGHSLHVNRTLIALGNQRQLVYYWFQQRGRVVTDEFAVKWYLFWDALTMHRTDGALIRIITALPQGGSEAEADRRLTEFAGLLAPRLPRFIPN